MGVDNEILRYGLTLYGRAYETSDREQMEERQNEERQRFRRARRDDVDESMVDKTDGQW